MLKSTLLLVAVQAVHGNSAEMSIAKPCRSGPLIRIGSRSPAGEPHSGLLQNLVARCAAHQRRHAKSHDPAFPANLHSQVLLRHADTMQGSLPEDMSWPAGGVPSLPAADADGALPQRQEGAEQEAVEDQALPAVLRWPHLLTLQLPVDAQQQRLRSTQRAGKAPSDARLCLQNSTAIQAGIERASHPNGLRQ